MGCCSKQSDRSQSGPSNPRVSSRPSGAVSLHPGNTSFYNPGGACSSNPLCSGASPSNPSGTSSSNPSGTSSSNPSGASSFKLRVPGGHVNPNETFLSRAIQTAYGSVLEERMQFDIGLYRGGIDANFHDCIVVLNAKHGCVTLELCYDPETRSRIIPMCQQLQGTVKDVEWKKQVECTLKELAEEAMDVWREMGSYSVIGRNCQDFCNHFLKRMDAKRYMTTVGKAAVGSVGILATGAIALLAAMGGSQ